MEILYNSNLLLGLNCLALQLVAFNNEIHYVVVFQAIHNQCIDMADG